MTTLSPTPDQQLLLDAESRHRHDPWFHAVLLAAIQETRDARKAVAVAEYVYSRAPKDTSTPADDDADALFGGGDVRESEENALAGDDAEKLDLIADIVGGLFGDDAIKFFDEPADVQESFADVMEWAEAEHPRGKHGRFIPKHSAEAANAANVEIDNIIGGDKTPDTHKSLVSHLGILSTKQLQEVKKKYGLKASGKNKAAIIKKLADKIHGKDTDKRKNRGQTSLRSIVKKNGGISIASLKAHGYDIGALRENGMGGLLRAKGGKDVDDVVGMLHSEGHIGLEGVEHFNDEQGAFSQKQLPTNAVEQLLDQLEQKAKTLHASMTGEYDQAYQQYLRELEDAKQHASESEIEEAIRSGEEAGRAEAESGDAWEGLGGVAAESGEVIPF